MTQTTITLSPCIKKCGLNEHKICRGCFRSIDEITGWEQMGEAEKQNTLEKCNERRQKRKAALQNKLG